MLTVMLQLTVTTLLPMTGWRVWGWTQKPFPLSTPTRLHCKTLNAHESVALPIHESICLWLPVCLLVYICLSVHCSFLYVSFIAFISFSVLLIHFCFSRKLKAWHIDDRPESMLLISGLPNVQALFNYLLNSKTLIPTVGAHTGIPPTILAPRAFEGASLKCLKVTLQSVMSVCILSI